MKSEMAKEKQADKIIKFKILLGFGFSFLAIVIAGIITWKSLSEVTSSVNRLSKPNASLANLHEVMTLLTETESSVRAYTLTKDEKYLGEYDKLLDTIDFKIGQIQFSAYGNPYASAQADTIAKLINDKKETFSLFIQMKKDIGRKEDLSSKILTKLDESVAGYPTIKKDTIVKQKTGFFAGVKKLFGSSEKKDVKETTEVKKNVKTDLQQVTQIVTTAQKEENVLTQLSGEKEMELLQRDKLVMDRIRTIINSMEADEEITSLVQAREAKAESDRAIIVVSIVAIAGGIFAILFLLLIFSDISKSNQYKRELIDARRVAEKLARVKEDFLSNMSHEIRTPLNSIIGFTEQLSQSTLDKKQAGYLKLVEKSSDHLLSLVNEILDFSRIEAGKLPMEKIPFSPAEVIKDVYELLRQKAAEKDIMLAYSVEDKLEDMILSGDPHRLKQILINLAGNGIKFTEKGMVEIKCLLLDDKNDMVNVKIEVLDTGIGIAADKLAYVFEEFSQAESDTSRRYGGTGLGLAICKRLVELQNGTIEVHSAVNKGSVFSITLPFAKAKEGIMLATGNKENKPFYSFQHKFALVVDDEDMNLQLARVILEKWGLLVDTAKSGKSAIRLLHERPYDIVFMDIHMPEMSGTEVVSQIREGDNLNKNTPFIALTANVMAKEQERFLKAGMNDILLKPFREKELYDKLTEVFEGKKNTINGNIIPAEGVIEKGNGTDPLYNLDVLEKTSGANKEFVLSMVESFMANNRRNISLMQDYLKQENWEAIGQLAHKMIPSYRYLGVKSSEINLKKIEQLALHDKKFEGITGLVEQVTFSTDEVMTALIDKVKLLKDELQPQ